MSDKNTGPKWLVYLKRTGYVATALLAISGVLYGVNGHYQNAEAAEYQHEQIQVASDSASYKANRDREEGDIRLQIEMIMLELTVGQPNEGRKAYLLQRLQILQNRLQVLEGADA